MRGSDDTICAIATPPGRGGIGIVRISGPQVPALAEALLGRLPSARHAHFARFLGEQGEILDEGLAVSFPAPQSFTGEDVLELQGHGGPVVLDRILRRLVELGARLAMPGEFSERAFHNGKLDLAQAEAVADLIAADTEAGARAALRSLQGEFSEAINGLLENLIELRVFVESAIDFPEEEIDFLSDGQLEQGLQGVSHQLDAVLATAQRGRLLRDGMTVVIAGRPNAGKSSLLNRLAGHEAAIVTPIAGTTRDLLREQIHLDGMPLHVIDTAGLRESDDVIEQEGVRRAWGAIASADRLLLVIDDQLGLTDVETAVLAKLPPTLGVTLIRNKIDITSTPAGPRADTHPPQFGLSAHTGAGLDSLRAHLKAAMGYDEGAGGFIARRRHLDALERARRHLAAGTEQLRVFQAGELLAEELRHAQQALGEITGEFTSDELLGRIFSSFCIGK